MAFVFLAISSLSFSPHVAPTLPMARASAASPLMRSEPALDRRSAVLSAAAAVAALPLVANAEIMQGGTSLGITDGKDYNSGTEDAIAQLAKKNAEALAAERAKKQAEYAGNVGESKANKLYVLDPEPRRLPIFCPVATNSA